MISAALITPGGDPVSLCILTIPLYFLFKVSILVGTLIERKKEDPLENVTNNRGIAGSLFLLTTLVFLGGSGAWLYQNWDKAESFILELSPKDKKQLKTPIFPDEAKHSLVMPAQESFILELSSFSTAENNTTNLPAEGIYRARIRP